MGRRKEELCGRCGAVIPPGRHIYSKYTKTYYCWDLDECDERAATKASRERWGEFIAMAEQARKELEDGFKAV